MDRSSWNAIAQKEETTMKHSMTEVGTKVEAGRAEIRTHELMQKDMQRKAPDFPKSKPFRPTMPADEYAELKAKLQAQGAPAEKPAATQPKPRAPIMFVGPNIPGATNVDFLEPPDTHGAIGIAEFVEVTNSHVDVFQRDDPTQRASMSLAAFFGYFDQPLFDPRAVYDSVWNRWVITAAAFAESSTRQLHFIAVSTTASAFGSFYMYAVNVTANIDDFWDYPQLGMDQDAVIITANIFDNLGFKGADMFAIAKARLYNGWEFSVPVFTGLVGTLAPPIVMDQNAKAFLICAFPFDNGLLMYTLTNSSRPNATQLAGPIYVPVDAYTIPPPAPQPGTTFVLDTLDSRFINASGQMGDSLWQVHTVNRLGFAAPKFYEINTATNTLIQSGFFFATPTSYDFNASIAVNIHNDIFLTWTVTDPAAGTNPQVRFSGCDHNDGLCFPGQGTPAFTSSAPYFGLRWGDYSAVTVDPSNNRHGWLVNEDAVATGDWGSRIVGIGFPP
jgi:hypothetical protein